MSMFSLVSKFDEQFELNKFLHYYRYIYIYIYMYCIMLRRFMLYKYFLYKVSYQDICKNIPYIMTMTIHM